MLRGQLRVCTRDITKKPAEPFFLRLGSSASRLWLHRTRTFALEPDPRPQQQSEPTFFVGGSCREFREQLVVHSSAKRSTSVDLPLSNTCKSILAYAAQEADKLVSRPIGTEHLLLGLLRENKSTVPPLLATAGISLHSARNRVRQEMGQPVLERELDREPEREASSRKMLRPFAAFFVLAVVLS